MKPRQTPAEFAQSVRGKYRAFPPIDLPERTWPGATITTPPIWCSVDLRDGNQSLIDPMDTERKMRLFKVLCAMGYKEIEIGFTASSQTDFDFARHLIAHDLVPDDVWLQVLTQARPDLIARTFESLRGARRAIVHLYNSTSTLQRRVVFNTDEDGICKIATDHAKMLLQVAQQPANRGVDYRFEYSPESFTGTELPFALRVCDEVTALWHGAGHAQVIINLAATVEMATPNIYADQIEWMHRNLARRDQIVLSLHPHNDRGTAVAAAELGIMAGADRIEGTLFGNGERTGNVDLVTLGMNLVSQGVDAGISFDDMPGIVRETEEANRLPVPARHPYGGDLVFTAFSGSHQDAINKGFKAQRRSNARLWEVPYLPVDPADIGRNYEAVIRVNSQSGKGGAAWVMERSYGISMPRGLQVEFSKVIQAQAEQTGKEVTPTAIMALFSREYLEVSHPYAYVRHTSTHAQCGDDAKMTEQLAVWLLVDGTECQLTGTGNGPISALVHAMHSHLGLRFEVLDYHQDAIGSGSAAKASAYLEIQRDDGATTWGVGQHANTVVASFMGVLNGLNRLAHRKVQGAGAPTAP